LQQWILDNRTVRQDNRVTCNSGNSYETEAKSICDSTCNDGKYNVVLDKKNNDPLLFRKTVEILAHRGVVFKKYEGDD
jgi:hypothetical protein